MTPVVAELIVAGLLAPAVLIFTIAYRHALRHWMRPASPIPTAAIASGRAVDRVPIARHFHAAVIGAAVSAAAMMGVIAVAMIAIAIIGAIIG